MLFSFTGDKILRQFELLACVLTCPYILDILDQFQGFCVGKGCIYHVLKAKKFLNVSCLPPIFSFLIYFFLYVLSPVWYFINIASWTKTPLFIFPLSFSHFLYILYKQFYISFTSNMCFVTIPHLCCYCPLLFKHQCNPNPKQLGSHEKQNAVICKQTIFTSYGCITDYVCVPTHCAVLFTVQFFNLCVLLFAFVHRW